jgi:UDP-N-acetylmuramoyl-L-alanyl-D-glutamate--2,6-diaminopimelate ligase
MPGLRFAILNADDAYSKTMQANCAPETKVLWYGTQADKHAEIHLISSIMQADGVELKLASIWGEATVALPLLGAFNISNILAVICCLSALNHPFSAILMALEKVKPVSGRMEKLSYPGCPTVVIDYAHTPDALEKALTAVREHCQAKVWVVFGCGGNRDRGKRPEMAKIAEQFADKVILTQDNSRLEDRQQIFADVKAGFKELDPIHIEPDRAKAIEFALKNASANDCILLAGKGHETYMDMNGEKGHFDEREVVKNFIESKAI